MVVGVVLDVIGVAHDGERSAVGVLLQLPGHDLQLGLGRRSQFGRVRGEGDIAGQGDGDVLIAGMGTRGTVQGPRVALDRRGFNEFRFGGGTLVQLGLSAGEVDIGLLSGVLVQHGNSGEAGLGNEDGDGVGVDLAEGQIGGRLFSRGHLQGGPAAIGRVPDPPLIKIQQAHPCGAGTDPPYRCRAQVVAEAEIVVPRVENADGCVCHGGVVLGSGQLQGHDRGGLVLADDGGDPHRDVVSGDMGVELLPVSAAALSVAAAGGRTC